MNGTQVENNKSNVVDGSRFVFEEPGLDTRRADEATQPMLQSQPSPDAFMPRPTRPFPISSRDENPKRGNWWNKIEFIFACIALCCSGTTFYSLPFRVLSNGGGIFLIMFVLAMIFFAFPYIVLEMALGQFSSSGIISVWNLSPLFKGFGVIAALSLALLNVTINVFSSYHLLYAFVTIKHSVHATPLPWLVCSHWWNTANCYDMMSPVVPVTTMNRSMPSIDTGISSSAWQNSQYLQADIYRNPFSPAKEYFSYEVYNTNDGDLTSIGPLRPSLVFALLATWGFILALTCMGAKWTGKVAYFIVPASVILLFVLLIRGATLPGALDGLIYFLHISDVHSFTSVELWQSAFVEAFNVSSMGLGVFIALSSYNKFHNNLCLDAFFVVTAAVVIKIMVLLIVATFAGFYIRHAGISAGDILYEGSGAPMTLTILPSIMGSLPVTNAWTCVFFITMFLLFTSASIFMVQALLTTLLDLFHLPHSVIFLLPTSGIICVLSFLVSLPMVTEGGFGVLTAVHTHTALWGAFVVAIILPLASVWVYGTIPKWNIMRLPREIQKMVGFFPLPFQIVFLLFWAAIIPLATALCFFKMLSDIPYSLGFTRPYWMEYILLALGLLPLLLIPILVGICQLLKKRRGYMYFTQLFWKAARPSDDWGPPIEHHRQQVGYAQTIPSGNRHQLNSSEIHFNPATNTPAVTVHDPTAAYPPPQRQFGPPPPAYNDYPPGQTSPGSAKNLSPAPSSVGSGMPIIYPSAFAGAGQSVSPATVSATDTLDSNRRYPAATVDYTTGAETDVALSEPEDSLFVNVSSHETTL
ncbi:sodium-dependent proline transporter-like [Patiria miniata]|uniref:Uncharacterized protein n=1 Tax=Patiria miniata TaxID=46514 RepID=A0A913ZVN7_PATMI|nr:sodium-dependent proline transporter-like [Patiria miniata]XP_038055340.1 sodium-dependent proline transporter-like [Patiria miniata]